MENQVKSTIDAASVATAVASFINILPAIAALASIIWTVLRIVEMITGKPIAELIKRKQDENNG